MQNHFYLKKATETIGATAALGNSYTTNSYVAIISWACINMEGDKRRFVFAFRLSKQ